MSHQLASAFIISFLASLTLTPLVRKLALRFNWVDHPHEQRKVHTVAQPRLGGIAIVSAFLISLFIFVDINRPLWGLLGGIFILLVLGVVDDIKGLRARHKLGWQLVAAVAVLAGGIGIVYITNPLGGLIHLDGWRIPIEIGSLRFNILPIANFVSIVWILGMINAVNLLDGLDGLAGGVSAIAVLVLFLLAISPASAEATVALMSIALLGSLIGFLPYNFFPSSIFMGDSGAYCIGLLLALLSIYGDSQIAVGSLVLGFAIIDMIWATLRRLAHRQSPFTPDRGHFHHRLIDSGLFSHRRAVIFIYILTTIVAVTILLAGGLAAFVLLILLLVLVMSFLRLAGPFLARRS